MNIKKILSFTCSTIAMLLINMDLDGADTTMVNLTATSSTFYVECTSDYNPTGSDGYYILDISNQLKCIEFKANANCSITITSAHDGLITNTTTKHDKASQLARLWNGTNSVQYSIFGADTVPGGDGVINMTTAEAAFDFELIDKKELLYGMEYTDTLTFTFTKS